MPLPHTLLMLLAGAGLWWGGHFAWSKQSEALVSGRPPALGISGSAYGSLAARLMRDGLYSYWHEGENATASAHAAEKAVQAPPPPGRFARRGRPTPPPTATPQATAKQSWLERGIDRVAKLEVQRHKRNSPFPTSASHRRYLEASADWRLRLAYRMDPGDAVLYEILHYQISMQEKRPQVREAKLTDLAKVAIQTALSKRAGLSEALTGAGAATNLLNTRLQRQEKPPEPGPTLQLWDLLSRCLRRYDALRTQANAEGWWEGIPEARREELDNHARFLNKVAETIGKQLHELKLLGGPQPGAHQVPPAPTGRQ